MAETTMFKPLGVIEEPSAPNQPEGAMRVAHNVSLREPGIIQPRPRLGLGDQYAGGTGLPASAGTEVIVEYKGAAFYCQVTQLAEQAWCTPGEPLFYYTAPSTGTPAQKMASFNNCNPVAKARDNLYFCVERGTRKISDLSDGTIRDTGAPTTAIASLNVQPVVGQWLKASEYVGYRVTVMREDPSGLIVESVSSDGFVVQNTSGSDAQVQVNVVANSPPLLNGDIVKVFRTQTATTASVGGNYNLVGILRYPDDVQPGGTYMRLVDKASVSEAASSEVLYTSPSQQGLINANFRPPTAKAIASFRGSVFWGNVIGPSRIQLATTAAADQTGNATGVGYRDFTGNIASGSPAITGVPTVTGIEVGMWVRTPSFFTNQSGFIVSITGSGPYTVTLDQNATVNGVFNGSAWDVIRIDDGSVQETFVRGTTGAVGQGGELGFAFYANKDGAFTISASLPSGSVICEATEYAADFIPGYTSGANVELFDRSSSGFTIQATHGNEYDPPIPLMTESPKAVPPDPGEGTLWWSKTDQPEHVPLKNFVRVGANSEPILALAPTKDRMYVFKTDGVWAATGFSADTGWRFDPVDMDCRLIAPNSVQIVDDAVVFLSDKGVEMLSGSTLQLLSKQVSKTFRSIVKKVSSHNLSAGDAWDAPVYSMYDPVNRDYILSSCEMVGDAVGETVVPAPNVALFNVGWNVLNLNTGQWASWAVSSPTDRRSSDNIYGSLWRNGELYIGVGLSYADYLSQKFVYDGVAADVFPDASGGDELATWTRISPAGNQPYGSYGTYTPAFASWPPYTVLEQASGGVGLGKFHQIYEPKPPDVDHIDVWSVIVDGALQSDNTYENAGASGTYFAWMPFQSIIWPATQFAGEPAEIKHWQEVTAVFEEAQRSAFLWSFQLSSDGATAFAPATTETYAQTINTPLLDGFVVGDGPDWSGTRTIGDSEPIPLTYPAQSNIESRVLVPAGCSRSTSLDFYLAGISGIGMWRLYGFLIRHRFSGKRVPLGYKRGQF